MISRFFPFLLLVLPLAEIAVFIVVGRYIGVLPTMALVILTTFIGAVLLRIQGFTILQRLTSESQAGRNPGKELIHGAMIVVAAVLLIVPGFMTDTLGFLLFIPALRDVVWTFLRSRMTVVSTASGFHATSHGQDRSRNSGVEANIVDLDEGEFTRDPDNSSPWSKP